MQQNKELLVLFQGDSVTDCGWDRNDEAALGNGYVAMVAAWHTVAHPGSRVRFVNRGVSGNRVRDLQERWERDCLDLSPDILSILIGINDVWRRYDAADPTPLDDFARGYRDLLERARAKTNARLVLLEPFVLPVPPDREAWREDLDPKIQTVRALAREYDALYVPLDGLFARASTRRPSQDWAADGVHPSAGGHALIARAWLETVDLR